MSRYKLLLLPLLLAISIPPSTPVQQSNPDNVCTQFYTDTLSKLILKFLENVRSHMDTGIPSMGIPPLDPLQIEDTGVRLKKPYQFDLNGRISNSKLEGLHSFNVTSISTSIFHMEANITITLPYIFVTGLYNLKGTALNFIPIRGNGPYILKPSSITTSIYTKLTLSHSHVQMKQVDFAIKMESLFAHFEGLFGGGGVGNLVNSLMNRFGLTLFRRIEPKVHEEVRGALLVQINDVLKDIPLVDLIGLINEPLCKSSVQQFFDAI